MNKKFKKKSHKRKKSDEDMQKYDEQKSDTSYHTQTALEIPNLENGSKNSFDLKINNYNIVDVIGVKGHINKYSKQSVSTGTYYFEVNIKSLDFNMVEYTNNKRNDEFSKKYYEVILNNIKAYSPNIRIGFINSAGDLDLAMGADTYSYSYRASDGFLVNEGEYLEGNTPLKQDDCIGALIHLKPPMPTFLKNVQQQTQNLYEKNTECLIKYFLNGKEQPIEFRGIWEGSYHAAITLYNFSQASINFGPKFRHLNIEENKNIKSFSDL